MPTEFSTKSRSALITREYATYSGKKPVQSKTIQQIAPKASDVVADPAKVVASQDWMPTAVGRDALKAVGRAALPKSVLRVAGSVARVGGPSVMRTLYAGDDASLLPLALALGAGEAVAAGRSVLVISEASVAVQEKFAALYPALAASCVLAADKASACAAQKGARVVLCGSDIGATIGAKASATFAVSVVVLNGADAEATSRLRHAAGSLAATRSVVVGPTVKAVTGVAVRGAAAPAPDASAAAASASGAPAKEALQLRPAVEMNYFVAQGIAKFNLLHTLVRTSGATKKILVRFATKEVASLYCDVLFALDVKAPILCDVEDDAAQDQEAPTAKAATAAAASPATAAGVPAAAFLRSTLRDFEQAPSGCVLLSAFGLTSPKAEVIFDFDPPADLQAYVASVLSAAGDDARAETHIMMFDPSCHVPAIAAIKHHAAALSAAAAGTAPAAAAAAASTETPSKKKSRSEAAEPATGKTGVWRFKKLPTPSAAAGFITGNKLRSLGKKLFSINNKGFKAYRSFVHYYALLRPVSIYDVYKLSLEEVAAQFGLDDVPLLDLRTKVTAFRPKEDYSKFANQREKKDRRDFRAYAQAHILPEVDPVEEAPVAPEAAA